MHYKPTDSAGEDGDAEKKQRCIEDLDRCIPALRELRPEVLIVTGDDSTSAVMKLHSWHPVPTILWADNCRPDGVKLFGERACLACELGPRFAATDLNPLVWLMLDGCRNSELENYDMSCFARDILCFGSRQHPERVLVQQCQARS